MISLFAGALRFLGLSQVEAADMLGVSEQKIKDLARGRHRIPAGIWDELSAFARRREVEIARLRSITVEDATFALETMGEPPTDFPCADSYVTTLAAAVLTSGKDGG